ncbi:uncharacterized protein LOC118262240 isoform X3 [Spodoptera frugiperda]|uniref:Uncharacterized protein LOC118262240 isoform X3 n=1 Tax=Spodoptera frugiperda TaxID=7108 RepID=A0A9R0DUI4_SPOFR|nr:uncharacterized protein LOC118262240 isoform X3 [Spodoptera frugiperda]
MAAEPVITSVCDMIDMAIGTPELGVVDFGMLQTVLHVLAQQLGVLAKNVELRGVAGIIPVGKPTDNVQTVAVSEFVVDTGVPGGYELATSPPGPDKDTVLVVERKRKSDHVLPMGQGQIGGGPTARTAKGGGGGGHPAPHPPQTPRSGHPSAPEQQGTGAPSQGAFGGSPSQQGGGAQQGPGRPGGQQGGPAPPPGAGKQAMPGAGPGPESISLVTLSKFNVLENTVEEMKNRVYGTTPKNEEILQEVRSQGNLKAITDMWTNMNVASRLDACEVGIGKLSSLVEDLIGETTELHKAAGTSPSPRMAQAAREGAQTGQFPGAAPGYGPPGAAPGYGPPGSQQGYGPPGSQQAQGGQPPQGYGPPPGQGGQPGQGYGPPGGQGQAYGPGQGGQQGQGYGPPGGQGQAYGPGQGGQQGQGYGPPGGQGQAYGPAQGGQQGQGYGPPGGQGQAYGPPGQPGQGGPLPGQGYGPDGGQGYGPPGGQQGQSGQMYGPPGEHPDVYYGTPGAQPGEYYGPPGAQSEQFYGQPNAQSQYYGQGGYGPPGGQQDQFYGPPSGQASSYGPPGGQAAPGYGPPGTPPAQGGRPGQAGQPAQQTKGGPPAKAGQQQQVHGKPAGPPGQGYGPPPGGPQGQAGPGYTSGVVLAHAQQSIGGIPNVAPGYSPLLDISTIATKDEVRQLLRHVQKIRNDLDVLTESFYAAMKEMNENFNPPADLPAPSTIASSSVGSEASQAGPFAPIGEPPASQYQPLMLIPGYIDPPQIPQIGPEILGRINQLERELRKCCDTIHKSDGVVNDQLTSFQDQLEYMSRQLAGVSGDLGAGKISPELLKDLQGLMQLFQTVQDMQNQLQQVHETAISLAAEKEDRQNHIDALLEQIELLKAIKLDREDMVEALADKADLRMLARKVSHDQFETACDDLSKGLEHALGKLNVQEALWQQALDDIQREIETKLDKMELSPVKEFFNNKLKQLQENLKQMAALRREAEAAGTKKRLLRDVNCISCDAKAVMHMEAPTPLPPKPLPATLSMKPYLSYELDAIRKAQASNLPQRNMHDWENLEKHTMPRLPHKVRSETDKHLCNRYCGGSHTVTTPAQRVARLGHFIKQWGPEVLPLSSGLAAGDDGRLYKISTTEGANVGPGGAVEGSSIPKSPIKKPETPKGPKPPAFTAECRCLDPSERPPRS